MRGFLTVLCGLAGGGVTPEINTTADLFSFSHLRNSSRLAKERLEALRNASMRERGMTGTIKEQLPIPTAPSEESSNAPLVERIGLGLPLSNIFATYFGKRFEHSREEPNS